MTILSPSQIATYARGAGFSGNALSIAVAIAMAESGGNTTAIDRDSNGSVDYGLWQINTVHGYNPSLLQQPAYNASAAYAVSSRGTDFTPWVTYNSGAYRRYLTSGVSVSSGTSPSQAARGASNGYPKGQCTWYADDRYHALTGFYVPWSGNAKDWVTAAPSYKWSVSSAPVTPSIVCLQPGVQGADPTYGHVAVAESINADGSVYASTQNWNNITFPNTTHWTFKPGRGVSFIYAVTGSGASRSSGSTAVGVSSPVSVMGFPTYTTLLDQVHETLINVPGFYGMALAIDEAEQFPGYIDLTQNKELSILGQDTGVQMPDVSGIVRSVGATITDNAVPVVLRGGLLLLGIVILIALILKTADDSGVAGLALPMIGA
jgi:surface antigen